MAFDSLSALHAASAPETQTPAAKITLTPIPDGIELTAEERDALSKTDEYSRGGTLNPPVEITRQQFIEDVLARGFLDLEIVPRGKFKIVRLTNPDFKLRSRNWYDFKSKIEQDYVVRRHKSVMAARQAFDATKLVGLEDEEPTVEPVPAVTVAIASTESVADEPAFDAPSVEIVAPSAASRSAADFEREITRFGVSYGPDGTHYRVIPAPEADTRRAADQFGIEITRSGVRDILSFRGTIEEAQRAAANAAYPPPVEMPMPTGEISTAEAARPEPEPEPVRELRPEERDFRYERGEQLTPRGRKARMRANVAAIKLVKQLEAEGRLATPEEKKILAQYNGWGGDKGAFDNVMARERETERQAKEAKRKAKSEYVHGYYYDEEGLASWRKEGFEEAYDALKAILTPDEWQRAAQSVLNAHYTSEELCHGLWDIARRAGFRGGAVLEPGSGPGRVLGAMPADLHAKSTRVAVELDPITASIFKHLNPQSEMFNESFETAPISDNSIDLVIGNVPFSDTHPARQRPGDDFNLHNYFIAESMAKLKPGGLAVLITSASTLENNDAQRKALAERAELLGAIRLPSDAFQSNANTEVVTDVLLLRKPGLEVDVANKQLFTEKLFVELEPEGVFSPKPRSIYERAPDPIVHTMVNEYFVRSPWMVLGKHSLNGSLYGRSDGGQYTVVSPKSAPPIEERFAAAVALLPENVVNSTQRKRRPAGVAEASAEETEQLFRSTEEFPGEYVLRSGRVYVVAPGGELERPKWTAKDFAFPRGLDAARSDQLAKDYAALKQTLRTLIATDLNPVSSDSESNAAREALKSAYDAFVKAHGTLSEHKTIIPLLSDDPQFGNVMGLEDVREMREKKGDREVKRKQVTPAAILSQRTLRPAALPTSANTLEEAVYISLGHKAVIDPNFVADLLGKSDVEAITEQIISAGFGYIDPATGLLESRARYLSGNVKVKLEAARRAAANEPRYQHNVVALEPLIPAWMPFAQINAQMGATWIPADMYEAFAKTELGLDATLRYYKPISLWDINAGWESHETRVQWGTKDMEATEIFKHAINQQYIRITKTVGIEPNVRTVLDEQATANANARADAMRERFGRWLKEFPERQQKLEAIFNDRFNSHVVPKYDGSYLTFPDLATGPGALVPMKHQRDCVARILQEQQGLAAHGVGYGKTAVGIIATAEMRRTGIARKPLIVCDNANYAQFADTYRKLYPSKRILCSDETSMTKENREAFKARIATGDWDCVLMARSHYERIPVSAETEERWLAEELSTLREIKEEMERERKGRGGRRGGGVRRVEKSLEAKEAKLKAQLEDSKARADRGLTWEQLGIDFVIVDECHREKKTGFLTRHQDIKGIDSSESSRGRFMKMKLRHIQERRGGGGGFGLTGTPCTNTMAEIWTQLHLFSPNTLKQFSVEMFDDFKSAFCVVKTEMELNEANGKWRENTRLSKFVNGVPFIQMVRTGMDVQMDSKALNLKLPKLKGGEIQLAAVPLTDAVAGVMDELAELYEVYEESTNKRDLSWVPLVLMSVGMAASIDPRLVDRRAPDETGSVLNTLVDNVVARWRKTAKTKSAQVIFLDRYNPMSTVMLDLLRKMRDRKMTEVERQIDDSADTKLDALDDGAGEETAAAGKEEAKPATDERPVTVGADFNLYDDIRDKLVACGIPAREIAIIHEAKKPSDRSALFDRVNAGEVRVVIGSSDKLGIGANFQERLVAAHHIDPPRNMTPDQFTQRNGRIERQGNSHDEVEIIMYGMEDTAVPGILHRIQRKDAFARQALAGRGVGMEFEDTGEVRIEEMKGALIRDKRALKRGELMATIRDEKMKREVVFDRARYLEKMRRDAEESLQRFEVEYVPKATAHVSWFAEHVLAPNDAKDQWRIQWNDGRESHPEMVGKPKEVVKELAKLVEEWKSHSLRLDQSRVTLGVLTVNGLPVNVMLEEVGFSDRRRTELFCAIPDPSDKGNTLEKREVGSAETIFRLVQRTCDYVRKKPSELESSMAVRRRDLEAAKAEIARQEEFDSSMIERLEKELSELERDMRENPYERGGGRKKGTRADAQTSSQEATSRPISMTAATASKKVVAKV